MRLWLACVTELCAALLDDVLRGEEDGIREEEDFIDGALDDRMDDAFEDVWLLARLVIGETDEGDAEDVAATELFGSCSCIEEVATGIEV